MQTQNETKKFKILEYIPNHVMFNESSKTIDKCGAGFLLADSVSLRQ